MARPWRYISGRKTPSLRALWWKQNRRCVYCSRETVLPPKGTDVRSRYALYASRDHRIPQARGGDNHPGNLLMACEPCNQTKGDMLPAEWADFMRDNPNWWARPVVRAVMTAAETAAWLRESADSAPKTDCV